MAGDWTNYYKDTNKVEVLIKYVVKLPSIVENFNIDNHPLHVRQQNNEIHVSYHKKITKTLFNDIKSIHVAISEKKSISEELRQMSPSKYIIGFIGETLQQINNEILKRKYNEGHILLKTVSQFDILCIFLVDENGTHYIVSGPGSVPAFPEVRARHIDDCPVFIKDLMDAMTEYFYFNFDESIRKVITSLENYFYYYSLFPAQSKFFRLLLLKPLKFKTQVKQYITEKYYPWFKDRDLKILRENILFVYKIRNLIVHDKLRLKSENQILSRKAIDTLLYIYRPFAK